MIKVFLADYHSDVRRRLKQILSSEKSISVVGEASSSEEIFKKLFEINWDLLVLDTVMPGKNDLDILIKIKKMFPGSKVLIVSMHIEPEVVFRALKTGADGYLNKDSASEELIPAVKEIWKGNQYIGSAIDVEYNSTDDTENDLYSIR